MRENNDQVYDRKEKKDFKMNSAGVGILLATYNGEKFIEEQLDSLKKQTYQDFVCYIHDDGSSDRTLQLVERYVQDDPKHFTLVRAKRCGSAKANFLFLLKYVLQKHLYYMFCDQDDIWIPDKIARSVQALKELVGDQEGIPALVYCDMKVVNEKLEVIAESFVRYNQLSEKRITVDRAVMKSYAAGCTMIINNALATEAVVSQSEQIFMHDMWLMLIAVGIGKVRFLDQPMALYRQHTGNVVGARRVTGGSKMKKRIIRIVSFTQFRITREGLYNRIRQLALCSSVEAFEKKNHDLVEGAVRFFHMNKYQRCRFVLKHHLYQNRYSVWWTCICA